MMTALKNITKGLGTLVVRNKTNYTTGILTDGDLKDCLIQKRVFKIYKLKK